jgi:hypothetical protein
MTSTNRHRQAARSRDCRDARGHGPAGEMYQEVGAVARRGEAAHGHASEDAVKASQNNVIESTLAHYCSHHVINALRDRDGLPASSGDCRSAATKCRGEQNKPGQGIKPHRRKADR